MSSVNFKPYDGREALMAGISDAVAAMLASAIAENGRACLAVPGGTTPGPFLRNLSDSDLDWAKVTVILSDERVVPPDNDRSNAKLVRETLMQNSASAAEFIDYNTQDSVSEAGQRLKTLLPIDALVLGMGADMHTASLFPDAPELGAALADDAPPLMEIRPAGQPETRLTLTGPVLRGAREGHILIAGREKSEAYERAMAKGPVLEAPVRVILTSGRPVTVHYAD